MFARPHKLANSQGIEEGGVWRILFHFHLKSEIEYIVDVVSLRTASSAGIKY